MPKDAQTSPIVFLLRKAVPREADLRLAEQQGVLEQVRFQSLHCHVGSNQGHNLHAPLLHVKRALGCVFLDAFVRF